MQQYSNRPSNILSKFRQDFVCERLWLLVISCDGLFRQAWNRAEQPRNSRQKSKCACSLTNAYWSLKVSQRMVLRVISTALTSMIFT